VEGELNEPKTEVVKRHISEPQLIAGTATKHNVTLLELDQARTVIRREEQEKALEGMNGVELA
jgi:hypothetical protein